MNGICLLKKCGKRAQIRGLCKPHYNVAYRLVSNHQTNWKALETAGKTKPAAKRGPKSPAEELLIGRIK